MHASVAIGGTPVMMSDGRAQMPPKFEGFALSLDAKDEAEAERTFAALTQGGQPRCRLPRRFLPSASACWLIASASALC